MSLLEGSHFTYAIACDALAERKGFIEIVGAGPGDPELISVKGKRFLEQADLILYAGSLVPVELTYYAKPGATVRSSASMDLEEQFAIMKEFYDKGLFIVRLHTGDPCIYGAIQEQMAFFDRIRHALSYYARNLFFPGSSSSFTIPIHHTGKSTDHYPYPGRRPHPDAGKRENYTCWPGHKALCVFS